MTWLAFLVGTLGTLFLAFFKAQKKLPSEITDFSTLPAVTLDHTASSSPALPPIQPVATSSPITQPLPPKPPIMNPDALLPWTSKENNRHNVRAICDLEGLTLEQKNNLCATVECESDFNLNARLDNRDKTGKVWSTDWGICQINDYYHIGRGKDFPTVQYVHDNPDACIRWMCKMWKNGQEKAWVCYSKGMYRQYL